VMLESAVDEVGRAEQVTSCGWIHSGYEDARALTCGPLATQSKLLGICLALAATCLALALCALACVRPAPVVALQFRHGSASLVQPLDHPLALQRERGAFSQRESPFATFSQQPSMVREPSSVDPSLADTWSTRDFHSSAAIHSGSLGGGGSVSSMGREGEPPLGREASSMGPYALFRQSSQSKRATGDGFVKTATGGDEAKAVANPEIHPEIHPEIYPEMPYQRMPQMADPRNDPRSHHACYASWSPAPLARYGRSGSGGDYMGIHSSESLPYPPPAAGSCAGGYVPTSLSDGRLHGLRDACLHGLRESEVSSSGRLPVSSSGRLPNGLRESEVSSSGRLPSSWPSSGSGMGSIHSHARSVHTHAHPHPPTVASSPWDLWAEGRNPAKPDETPAAAWEGGSALDSQQPLLSADSPLPGLRPSSDFVDGYESGEAGGGSVSSGHATTARKFVARKLFGQR